MLMSDVEVTDNTIDNNDEKIVPSGRELIMPASSSSMEMRMRKNQEPERSETTRDRREPNNNAGVAADDDDDDDNEPEKKKHLHIHMLRTAVIHTVNLLLISAILHLLVIPELVYQNHTYATWRQFRPSTRVVAPLARTATRKHPSRRS